MEIDATISFLDVFIVLVLIFAIFKGYKRGPVVHAISLLIIVSGIAIFGYMSEGIADYIRERIRSNENLPSLHLYIFAFLFSATVWLSNFVADRIEKGAGSKPKGILNISLGIIASVIKYLYLLSVLLLFFAGFDKSYNIIGTKEKNNTKFYKTVKNIAPDTIKSVAFLKD
ncbi:MAG: CvpA family protein [Bacteroidales bacterium]|nr:CvpA family protein [Bacteroidales bacterium]